jgi:hypothetical protein
VAQAELREVVSDAAGGNAPRAKEGNSRKRKGKRKKDKALYAGAKGIAWGSS